MILIAHRSGPSIYPEQTILSAQEALKAGADIVEVDVRFTADKQLAITHDPNLQRIFGVDKNICDITAKEFMTYRHKTAPGFCAHMLEDYLLAGIAPLLIHVKQSEVLPALLDTLKKHNYCDKTILGISQPQDVSLIRNFDARIKILAFQSKPDMTQTFIDLKVDYVRLWERWLQPDLAQLIKKSSAQLWIMSGSPSNNTVGEPSREDLVNILTYEPDGILINNIPFAKEIIPHP